VNEHTNSFGLASAAIDAERLHRLRTATESERMQERLRIFADVDPRAPWLPKRRTSGLVAQQHLFAKLRQR
jgi:hypothetical protein